MKDTKKYKQPAKEKIVQAEDGVKVAIVTGEGITVHIAYSTHIHDKETALWAAADAVEAARHPKSLLQVFREALDKTDLTPLKRAELMIKLLEK